MNYSGFRHLQMRHVKCKRIFLSRTPDIFGDALRAITFFEGRGCGIGDVSRSESSPFRKEAPRKWNPWGGSPKFVMRKSYKTWFSCARKSNWGGVIGTFEEKKSLETASTDENLHRVWVLRRGWKSRGLKGGTHVVLCKWENFAHQHTQIEWNYQFKWNLHLLVVAWQWHWEKLPMIKV